MSWNFGQSDTQRSNFCFDVSIQTDVVKRHGLVYAYSSEWSDTRIQTHTQIHIQICFAFLMSLIEWIDWKSLIDWNLKNSFLQKLVSSSRYLLGLDVKCQEIIARRHVQKMGYWRNLHFLVRCFEKVSACPKLKWHCSARKPLLDIRVNGRIMFSEMFCT